MRHLTTLMPAALIPAVFDRFLPLVAMLARIATLSLTAVFAHADVHVPTREIAAGVQMPVISIGAGNLLASVRLNHAQV